MKGTMEYLSKIGTDLKTEIDKKCAEQKIKVHKMITDFENEVTNYNSSTPASNQR